MSAQQGQYSLGDIEYKPLGPDPVSTIENEAKGFGLRVSSGLRSANRNAAAGGSPTSRHLVDDARDLAGDPDSMSKFYRHMRSTYGNNLKELYYDPEGGFKDGNDIGAIGKHGDHVHVSIGQRGQFKLSDAVPATGTAGQGAAVSTSSAPPPASRFAWNPPTTPAPSEFKTAFKQRRAEITNTPQPDPTTKFLQSLGPTPSPQVPRSQRRPIVQESSVTGKPVVPRSQAAQSGIMHGTPPPDPAESAANVLRMRAAKSDDERQLIAEEIGRTRPLTDAESAASGQGFIKGNVVAPLKETGANILAAGTHLRHDLGLGSLNMTPAEQAVEATRLQAGAQQNVAGDSAISELVRGAVKTAPIMIPGMTLPMIAGESVVEKYGAGASAPEALLSGAQTYLGLGVAGKAGEKLAEGIGATGRISSTVSRAVPLSTVPPLAHGQAPSMQDVGYGIAFGALGPKARLIPRGEPVEVPEGQTATRVRGVGTFVHEPTVTHAEVRAAVREGLDLILDTVKSKQHEVAIDVRDFTPEQKQRVIDTAQARGLDAASDGKFVLVRDLSEMHQGAPASPVEPATPTAAVEPKRAADVPRETLPAGEPVHYSQFQEHDPKTGEFLPGEPVGYTPKEDRLPETTGIARRVEEARRGPVVNTGKGIGAQESVEHGRELLNAGRDPQTVLDDFKKTGAVSADAMALVRAKHEQLARAANQAFDTGGLNSAEFKTAEKARQDFWEGSVRPMQTAWSNTGRAQQGETAIDTGTFYGIYRAFKQETGREMSPREQAAARQLADRVAAKGVDSAEKQLIDRLNKATGIGDLAPDVQQALSRFITDSRRETRTQKRQTTKKTLDEEAAVIKTNLAAAFKKVSQGSGTHPAGLAGIDPEGEITKYVIQYAKNRVKAGIVDTAQLVDDVHTAIKDFADVGKREIAETLAGLGGTKREKRAPSDWMVTKGEIKKGLKTADAAQTISDIGARLAAGEKAKPEEVKTIWTYANERYIDKGVGFGDTVQNLATDLGATPDQVRRALATATGTKPLADAVYRRMAARRQTRSAAEQWVKNADRSPALKAVQGTADAFFNAKTFGHGTVAPLTHVGASIYHPTRWVSYFKNMGRTYRAAYSSAAHERYMQDLVNSPNYITARRAGLKNEPGKFYDEYQNNLAQKMFGAIGKIGNRGFDILKTTRQDFFDAQWNKLDASQQTPEMAKEIATLINHATGATDRSFSHPLVRTVFFAAPLEASRWARILGDPVRAADIFTKMAFRKSITPAERYFAKSVMKNHAEFTATYLASLALNQAILTMTGSDDKINFTDPSKGDWLRHKIKGRAIESTGGIIATIDFLGKLGQAAFGEQNPREGRGSRMGHAAYLYGRGKLSPLASTVADFATQADFRDHPMPFSSDKEHRGKPRYSWPEYLLSQQSPIPIAEAAHDFFDEMHKQGVPLDTTKAIFSAAIRHPGKVGQGLGIGAASGSTGVRIGTEYQPNAGRGDDTVTIP